jgi:hypothetical protein
MSKHLWAHWPPILSHSLYRSIAINLSSPRSSKAGAVMLWCSVLGRMRQQLALGGSRQTNVMGIPFLMVAQKHFLYNMP